MGSPVHFAISLCERGRGGLEKHRRMDSPFLSSAESLPFLLSEYIMPAIFPFRVLFQGISPPPNGLR